MKRVVVESPLAGNFRRNIRYAQLCLLDCLRRGEAPFASHLLYPQVLDDRMGGERLAGIEAGFAWVDFADVCAVYEDFGVSSGMERGVARAESVGITVERRRLPPDLLARVGEDPALWETLKVVCDHPLELRQQTSTDSQNGYLLEVEWCSVCGAFKSNWEENEDWQLPRGRP